MFSSQTSNLEVGSLFHIDVAWGGGIPRELLEAWRSLAEGVERPVSLCQSPEFFEHLRAIDRGESLALVVVRNDDEAASAGVVPLRIRRLPLTYHIEGRVLWKFNLKGVEFIGGTPCIPDDAALRDLLFKTLGEKFSAYDLLALSDVPTEGLLWEYLHRSEYIKENFLTYAWNGVKLSHAIKLPGTFEKYLVQYKPETPSRISSAGRCESSAANMAVVSSMLPEDRFSRPGPGSLPVCPGGPELARRLFAGPAPEGMPSSPVWPNAASSSPICSSAARPPALR